MKIFGLAISSIVITCAFSCQAKRKNNGNLAGGGGGGSSAQCDEIRKTYEKTLKEYLEALGIEKLESIDDIGKFLAQLDTIKDEAKKARIGELLSDLINSISQTAKIAESEGDVSLRLAGATTNRALNSTTSEACRGDCKPAPSFNDVNSDVLEPNSLTVKGGDEKAALETVNANNASAKELKGLQTLARHYFGGVEAGIVDLSRLKSSGSKNLLLALTMEGVGRPTIISELKSKEYTKAYGAAFSAIASAIADNPSAKDAPSLASIFGSGDSAQYARATMAAAAVEATNFASAEIDFGKFGITKITEGERAEAIASVLGQRSAALSENETKALESATQTIKSSNYTAANAELNMQSVLAAAGEIRTQASNNDKSAALVEITRNQASIIKEVGKFRGLTTEELIRVREAEGKSRR